MGDAIYTNNVYCICFRMGVCFLSGLFSSLLTSQDVVTLWSSWKPSNYSALTSQDVVTLWSSWKPSNYSAIVHCGSQQLMPCLLLLLLQRCLHNALHLPISLILLLETKIFRVMHLWRLQTLHLYLVIS